MQMKTKTFDAVEMSRRLREETSRELNAMSREERIEHLRQVRENYAREYAARHLPKTREAASSSQP